MSPLLLGGIVDAVGKVADDLFTSDKERLDAEVRFREIDLQAAKVDADLVGSQIEVNKEEAKHASLFVSGARPAVVWVGVAALAYKYIAHPLLLWGWALAQAQGYLDAGAAPPPSLDTEEVLAVLFGVLGIGGMRTFEKVRGVARDRIK